MSASFYGSGECADATVILKGGVKTRAHKIVLSTVPASKKAMNGSRVVSSSL